MPVVDSAPSEERNRPPSPARPMRLRPQGARGRGASREPARAPADTPRPAWPAADDGLLEGGHVDDEAVAHVLAEQTLVRLVDLAHRDQLDVRRDLVGGAEIEHLLRLGDAADQRAREAAAPRDHAERL